MHTGLSGGSGCAWQHAHARRAGRGAVHVAHSAPPVSQPSSRPTVGPPTTSVGINPELLKAGGLDPATQSDAARQGYADSLKHGFLPVNLSHPNLRVMCLDPPVMVIDNFVSGELCDQLIEAAKASGKLQASMIGGYTLSEGADKIRTSRTFAMTQETVTSVPGLKETMDGLLSAAAGLINLAPLGQDASSLKRSLFSRPSGPGQVVAELPQVAHYMPGQHFLSHEDAFPAKIALEKGYQRRATLLIYLNDVAEGGSTYFDRLGFGVQPRKARALLFFPSFSGGMPDARTLHTAQDAVDEKWVFQLWLSSGLPKPRPPAAGAVAAANKTKSSKGKRKK